MSAPHPAIDRGDERALVTETRADVAYLSEARADLLLGASAAGRRVLLVSDEVTRLTYPLREALRDAHAGWVVRAVDGTLRDGFDGRRLESVADAVTPRPLTSADDVAVRFLRPEPAQAVQLVLQRALPEGLRVTVGGVAGGVGTTTVAALLRGAAAWRSGPGEVTVVDGGREPWLTTDLGDAVVVVCRADRAGLARAVAAVGSLGEVLARRAVVVPVAVGGRGPGDAALLRLTAQVPCPVVPVPQDRALAAGAPSSDPAETAASSQGPTVDLGKLPDVAPRAVALLAEVLALPR